ncbi:MAG: GNAT family protein [Sulfuritalea sp.]|nr:GNAT family protein [Sulfuritalea sp.]
MPGAEDMGGSSFILSGERLYLCPFTESDITVDYIRWLNDPEVLRFSNQRFRHHDEKSCLAYLRTFADSDNLFLAVHLADDKRLIGTMTAYVSSHHGTADLGLLIGERGLWGHGFGLEAWNLLLDYLLRDCKLRKITAGTLRCNLGMTRIMERSGMRLEAVRSQQEMVDGEPQDALYFAKFREN